MPTTIKEERYRCIKPILDKEIKIKDVAKISTHSERSIKRWLCAYRAKGMNGLEPKSTRPKTHRCDTLIRTKERVLEIRKQEGLCALKINYRLKKENVKIGLSTISKILKTEGVTRKYKVRKLKYKYIKVPLQQRSHREDQEKFYERNTFVSFVDLKNKMIIWNNYYNNLEHCSLDGKTPNEMLLLESDICV